MKQKSLANCTLKELRRFRRMDVTLKDFWLLCDSNRVCIHEQTSGHPSLQRISIPRKQFNRLVAGYLKPRKFVRREMK